MSEPSQELRLTNENAEKFEWLTVMTSHCQRREAKGNRAAGWLSKRCLSENLHKRIVTSVARCDQ